MKSMTVRFLCPEQCSAAIRSTILVSRSPVCRKALGSQSPAFLPAKVSSSQPLRGGEKLIVLPQHRPGGKHSVCPAASGQSSFPRSKSEWNSDMASRTAFRRARWMLFSLS